MRIKISEDCKIKRPDGKEVPFTKNQVLVCDSKWGKKLIKDNKAVDITTDSSIYSKEEVKEEYIKNQNK